MSPIQLSRCPKPCTAAAVASDTGAGSTGMGATSTARACAMRSATAAWLPAWAAWTAAWPSRCRSAWPGLGRLLRLPLAPIGFELRAAVGLLNSRLRAVAPGRGLAAGFHELHDAPFQR